MARISVTLSRADWLMTREILGFSGTRDVEDQVRKLQVYKLLTQRLEQKEGSEFSISLSRGQRNILIDVLSSPGGSGEIRVDAIERVWSVKGRLGWTPPAIEEPDEEE